MCEAAPLEEAVEDPEVVAVPLEEPLPPLVAVPDDPEPEPDPEALAEVFVVAEMINVVEEPADTTMDVALPAVTLP